MIQALQVVCIAKAETNWGHRHIVGLGTAPAPGTPDRWPMPSVLGRLAGGDIFYIVNELREPVFLHRHRCWCGTETVRAATDPDAADPLDALPACEREPRVESAMPLPSLNG